VAISAELEGSATPPPLHDPQPLHPPGAREVLEPSHVHLPIGGHTTPQDWRFPVGSASGGLHSANPNPRTNPLPGSQSHRAQRAGRVERSNAGFREGEGEQEGWARRRREGVVVGSSALLSPRALRVKTLFTVILVKAQWRGLKSGAPPLSPPTREALPKLLV